MSDDKPTIPSEREDATKEVEPEAETQATEEKPQTKSEPREKLDATKEEKPKDKSKAKVDYAQKAEDSWAKQITDGDKTLEELQEKQPWLAERVQSRLGIEKEEKPQSSFDDQMKTYEQNKQFKDDMSFMESLPTAIHNKIVRKAKSYQSDLGADTEKALRQSIEDFKPEIDEQKTTRKSRVAKGSLDVGTLGGQRVTYSQSDLADMDQTEYNRIMELATKGEVEIK